MSPGEARMTGAMVVPSKAKASRPFSFTACSVRDKTCLVARTCEGSGKETVCAHPRAERNICAPAKNRMRARFIELVPSNSIDAAQLLFVPESFGVSQATAGWRRCHQSGELFCRVRTGLPRPPLPSWREELLPGKSPWAEKSGRLGGLAEGSEANRSP